MKPVDESDAMALTGSFPELKHLPRKFVHGSRLAFAVWYSPEHEMQVAPTDSIKSVSDHLNLVSTKR
jgi:hypothetical protein